VEILACLFFREAYVIYNRCMWYKLIYIAVCFLGSIRESTFRNCSLTAMVYLFLRELFLFLYRSGDTITNFNILRYASVKLDMSTIITFISPSISYFPKWFIHLSIDSRFSGRSHPSSAGFCTYFEIVL
jgi:hypothetical protein